MNLNIGPIVSALLHNRVGPLLVALQIAVALAVLVNCVYIAKQRVEKMSRPSGLDVENIIVVKSLGFAKDFDHAAAIREDLAYLRSVEGVRAATPTSHFPIAGGVYDDVLAAQPDQETLQKLADYYEVDEQAIEAFGVRLVAGRNFEPHEILPAVDLDAAQPGFVPQVIVTRALARELFPGENALGRTVYDRVGSPATIIGIVERMHAGWVNWDHVNNVFFMPRLPTPFGGHAVYIVRTRPGMRDNVLRTIEEHLPASNPGRVIEWIRPLEAYRDRAYRADRNMGLFLATVTALFLAITALGVFGLAAFNVTTRTKQIGTRRAVGARRRDIVLHFLVENWLVTTVGVVLGCVFALGAGYWLSLQFGLPRLDLYYLLGGVLALWGLGLLATWHPARRAAAVPPAVATRTV
jgi:putative ABC transport system permease protein